jgi:hypothetical protein
MDEEKWRHRFYFAVAIVFSILLVWFGIKFLTSPTIVFSTPELLITGGVFIIVSIILASKPALWKYWRITVLFVLLGIYFCARAAGSITEPWLSRVMGAASIISAAILLYITWPGRK